MASIDDINMWSITQVDTLSALMDSSDGAWDPSLVSKQVNKCASVLCVCMHICLCILMNECFFVVQAKAIISKYLSKEGNTLGSAELNAIAGANLCSLDTNVLKSISQQSLK